jgi:hypothetical protein
MRPPGTFNAEALKARILAGHALAVRQYRTQEQR